MMDSTEKFNLDLFEKTFNTKLFTVIKFEIKFVKLETNLLWVLLPSIGCFLLCILLAGGLEKNHPVTMDER